MVITVQQLIANRHPEQRVTHEVVHCVFCNEIQPLYIISKISNFLFTDSNL